MLHISRRARVILDVMFGVAVVMAVISTLGVMETGIWRDIVLLVAAAATVACWVAWRRQRLDRSRTVVLLAIAAGVTMLAGDGQGGLPLIFVVLAVVVVEHGARAGLLTALGITTSASLMMAFVYDRSALDNLLQSVAAFVLLGLGIALGMLLREVDQARRENARLLGELRTSFQAEKDHVLADERARAARDLHDGLGHQLTAIRMGLDFAERVRGRDDEAAWEEIARCRDLSVVALDRMRVWVRALDPIPVQALTDAGAFEAVAEAFRGTGLEVRVTTSGADQPLDRETALFALRVAQEGLTNALRHAGARRVELAVDHRDTLTITLTDDGGSSDAEPSDADPGVARPEQVQLGYGLRALSERARVLGGSVEAGWTPRGFRLSAQVPAGREVVAA